MRPELILWDWNGTLLDDVELCLDALNRLLARFGYPQRYDMASYRKIFGFPVKDYYLRAGMDFSRHPFTVLAESYMADYIPHAAACTLAPGAQQVLQTFADAGLRQVILSASPVDVLEQQVCERGIRPYFDRLLGLGDIYAKSKVELGLNYLHESGLDPKRAVMIGDTVHDFEVAQAMGVVCVLQCGGHQDAETLRTTGAPVYETLGDAAARILEG
nr:HAD family hydrolase [uncultured Gemmiger sp.]